MAYRAPPLPPRGDPGTIIPTFNPPTPTGPVHGGGPQPGPPSPSHAIPQHGNTGLTPPLIAARYTGANRNNVRSLRGDEWQRIDVDRPTILRPVDRLRAVYTTAPTGLPVWKGGGSVFYAPEAIPPGSNDFDGYAAASYPDFSQCMRSVGRGVVYLSNPGAWWVCYANGFTDSANFLQIDANDPNVAARYLNEPGNHTSYTQSNFVTGAAADILVVNPYRHSALIQNTGTVAVRVAFGSNASAANGYSIAAGGSLFLSDKTIVQVRVSAFSAAAGLLEIVEWV